MNKTRNRNSTLKQKQQNKNEFMKEKKYLYNKFSLIRTGNAYTLYMCV